MHFYGAIWKKLSRYRTRIGIMFPNYCNLWKSGECWRQRLSTTLVSLGQLLSTFSYPPPPPHPPHLGWRQMRTWWLGERPLGDWANGHLGTRRTATWGLGEWPLGNWENGCCRDSTDSATRNFLSVHMVRSSVMVKTLNIILIFDIFYVSAWCGNTFLKRCPSSFHSNFVNYALASALIIIMRLWQLLISTFSNIRLNSKTNNICFHRHLVNYIDF